MLAELLQALQQAAFSLLFQLLEGFAQLVQSGILLRGLAPALTRLAQWRDDLPLPGPGLLLQDVSSLRRTGHAAPAQPAGGQQQADIRALGLQLQAGAFHARTGVAVAGKTPQVAWHRWLRGEEW